MRKQAASMSNIIHDNEYGLYFPGGIDEYHLHIIARHIGVRKERPDKWTLYINGKRVRTPTESSSHPCPNCGHCIDNGISSCGNRKCMRDWKKRGLCNRWLLGSGRGGGWIHEIKQEHVHQIKKKGIVYNKTVCESCYEFVMWLGEYPVDHHVIQYNRIIKKQHKVSVKYKPNNRTSLGEQRHLCLSRGNFKCRDCGVSKDDEPLEVDHIIPYSKGGLTHLDNLQTLCRKCNRSKHTRTWRGGE